MHLLPVVLQAPMPEPLPDRFLPVAPRVELAQSVIEVCHLSAPVVATPSPPVVLFTVPLR